MPSSASRDELHSISNSGGENSGKISTGRLTRWELEEGEQNGGY
jgi:hypothetical protein